MQLQCGFPLSAKAETLFFTYIRRKWHDIRTFGKDISGNRRDIRTLMAYIRKTGLRTSLNLRSQPNTR